MRYRLKSPYIILGFFSLFFLTLASWIIGAELIKIPFSYGDDVAMNYKEYLFFMFDSMLTWELFIDSAMRYFCLIFPVFSGVAIAAFYEELHKSLIIGLTRIENYRKKIFKLCSFYTLVGGFVTIIPLIILITFASPLLVPSLEGIGELSNLFPDGFYYKHSYIVFLFMICVLYFLLAISYSIMSVGLALVVKNKIYICLVPFGIYFAENVIASIIGGFLPLSTINVVTSFNTLKSVNSLFIPIAVNYAIAIIIFMLCFYFRNKQEVIE